MKKIIVTTAFTLCCYITLFAQDAGSMKAWQDYMTPGDVHKMLAKYNGDWNEAITFWMQPGAPPTQATSTAHTEMIMGGRYQESKITGNMMGMPFEGFSLLGYDNLKKIFTSTWVDNFGTGTTTLQGTWDSTAKMILLDGKEVDPMSGNDMDIKETIQFIDDNTQKIVMFKRVPLGEIKTMEITLTRAMH